MNRVEYERRWYEEQHRLFMEAIQPTIEIKMRVYSITLPRMLIYPDGRTEVEYDFTPEQRKILDQCDEYIEHIKQQAYKDCPFPRHLLETISG